jgi:hypothetical protein
VIGAIDSYTRQVTRSVVDLNTVSVLIDSTSTNRKSREKFTEQFDTAVNNLEGKSQPLFLDKCCILYRPASGLKAIVHRVTNTPECDNALGGFFLYIFIE